MSILKNLEIVLSCPICFENYDDKNRIPISMKCKHHLCKDCAKTLLRDNCIVCPQCRLVSKIESIDDVEMDYHKIFKEIVGIYQTQIELVNKKENNEHARDGEQVTQNDDFAKIKNRLHRLKDLKSVINEIHAKKKEWNHTPVRIAFIGKSKTGKSTLINTLRGKAKTLKGQNNTDLAETDVIQCTEIVTAYRFQNNQNIFLCDVPGVGTPKFRKSEDYLKLINFKSYDLFVLITAEGFSEEDEWLIKNIKATEKPFCFVYTKLDSTINNHLISLADYDDLDEDERQTERTIKMDLISNECQVQIKKLLGNEATFKLFLISGLLRNKSMYDYAELNIYMSTSLPKLKRQILTSVLKPLTNKLILEKTTMLLQRIEEWKSSFDGFRGFIKGIGALIQSYFKNYLHNFLVGEIKFYAEVFEVDAEKLSNKSDEVKKLLERYKDINRYVENFLRAHNIRKVQVEKESDEDDSLIDTSSLAQDPVFSNTLSYNLKNPQSNTTQSPISNASVKIDEKKESIAKNDLIDSITGSKKVSFRSSFVNEVHQILIKIVEDMQTACVMIISEEISNLCS